MTTIEEPHRGQIGSAGEPGAHDDALRFLESVLAGNPELSDAALGAEVDALLGRQAPRAASKPPVRRWKPASDDDEAPEFGWLEHLLELAPAPDNEYVNEAARRVEVGLFAEERIAQSDLSQLSRWDIAELSTLAAEGKEAWRWLVLSNLRLVFHWSKGVARSVDPDWAQDAFQVGCIGLMRGLQGWDYRMGYKLSTFVSWHVRQAIQRWRANDVMIVRVPVHVWDALNSGDAALSSELRASAMRAQSVASLDAMLHDRGEDAPWDGGLEAIEDRIDRERAMKDLLSDLDHRSLDIVERRFGLRDDLDVPMTLDEIGDVWNVTRERIRQLEKKILIALRARANGEVPAPIGAQRVGRE
ncbi:sigma-70 family RNA polymerase sigma factor [Microbacterium sp.]|uniref:sigma-70 family RNA polymerase sigma factor n=1 Tax=Microbacterium sp. TaxID=51671 RepID=UPI0028116388|nr:sigma-70 family RNA polymerase sigma factor [Microbacterium sp.]